MKAQDLRIKDIVNNSVGDPIVLSIYNILLLWQWELQVRKYKGDPPFTPVELTEDWLIKFGGICHPWGWVIDDNGILIQWNHINEIKKFWIELGNGNRIDLPYVHTLQNFFDLANEELTIK